MAARDFDAIVSDVVGLLETARRAAARSVNAILTETYWEIGRRIVEEEQRRRSRSSEYGKALVTRLSADLTERFGRGFARRSLFRMRSFYLAYQDRVKPQIVPTALALSRSKAPEKIVQTPFALSRFPLPWSHYIELLPLDEDAREFYEREALHGGWSHRQLERQIATQFFERSSASRGGRAPRARAPDEGPRDELRDPYVLEFLGLPDDFGESDVEDALIRELETFLLELGGHFAFIGRQRRLRIGDQWHRIDLLLFHRRLRCLVIIDLKLGALTGADTGPLPELRSRALDAAGREPAGRADPLRKAECRCRPLRPRRASRSRDRRGLPARVAGRKGPRGADQS